MPRSSALEDPVNSTEWEHAKYVFKSSLLTAVTFNDHLVHVHWIISNNLLFASRQSFAPTHPVRRLLKIHTYRAAAINWASKTVLMPVNALGYRVFAMHEKDWFRAIHDCVHANKFETFETFIDKKGLDPATESSMPYLEDGRQLWAVIHKYVSTYIGVYYKTDADVLADPDLHDYWSHYARMPMWPSYNLPALSLAALVDQITQSIFGVTGVHEFVGSIVEYLISPQGLGSKILPGRAESDVQSHFQLLSLIALTGLKQPALINDWSHIHLHEGMTPDQRQAIATIIHQFQVELKALSAQIDVRNLTRKKRFMALNPSVLECAVAI